MRYLLAVAVDGKAEEKKKKHDDKMIAFRPHQYDVS